MMKEEPLTTADVTGVRIRAMVRVMFRFRFSGSNIHRDQPMPKKGFQ